MDLLLNDSCVCSEVPALLKAPTDLRKARAAERLGDELPDPAVHLRFEQNPRRFGPLCSRSAHICWMGSQAPTLFPPRSNAVSPAGPAPASPSGSGAPPPA